MKKTLLTGRFKELMLWNFKIVKKLMAVGCLILLLNACKKDSIKELESIKSNKDEVLYNKLIKTGFKKEDIKDVGNAYLVEEDMLFEKFETDFAYFDKYFSINKTKEKNNNIETKQYSINNIVSHDNSERIIISKDNSLPNSFFYPIQQAATNWSQISNTTLSMYFDIPPVVSTQNKIIIKAGFAGGGFALAKFPTNSQAGFQIEVNLSESSNLTTAQKIFLITHEIGHCIGFRHTDNPGFNDEFGTILIPGTPVQDAQSVMNSAAAFGNDVPTIGFSYYDLIASQNLYAPNTYYNLITGPFQKFPNNGMTIDGISMPIAVTWNNNLLNTSTVSIQVYQYGLLKTTLSNLPNNGSYSFPIAQYLNNSSGSTTYGEAQLRIISDDQVNVYDYSPLFYLYND